MNTELMKMSMRELKKLPTEKLSELIVETSVFIKEKEEKEGTLFVQPFRLKVIEIDKEITRRLRSFIKEKRMNTENSLQLVPPVITQTAEKADTTKEKSMSTTQGHARNQTSPEVIAKIKELRSGDSPMSLSGVATQLKISFETAKKYDPQQTNKKPARADEKKVVKKVAKKVEKKAAPKKVEKKAVPASLKKAIKEKVQPKKEAKSAAPVNSNKSKITMLTSEIRGKLTLLEALVRKEIESKK